jgi:hypothetical protein
MPGLHHGNLEGRAEIARSPREVFDFLTDVANWSRLDEALVDLSPKAGLSPGSTGTATHRRAGVLRATTSWEVIDFIPAALLTIRIVGRGYELTETVELAPTTSGTTVTVTDLLAATSLLGRLMVPLSGGIVRRDLNRRSARLKAVLETETDG